MKRYPFPYNTRTDTKKTGTNNSFLVATQQLRPRSRGKRERLRLLSSPRVSSCRTRLSLRSVQRPPAWGRSRPAASFYSISARRFQLLLHTCTTTPTGREEWKRAGQGSTWPQNEDGAVRLLRSGVDCREICRRSREGSRQKCLSYYLLRQLSKVGVKDQGCCHQHPSPTTPKNFLRRSITQSDAFI